MLLPVLQHVQQRSPCFARRPQSARVILAVPDSTDAIERAVQRARCPDLEARQAPPKGSLVSRFDDDVKVIGLDGELNDSKLGVRRGSYRRAEGGKQASGAEGNNPTRGAEGDVDRVMVVVLRAGAVRHRSTAPLTQRASGAATRAAPGGCRR